MTPMTEAAPLPIRLARPGEAGVEFIKWLNDRARGNAALRQRLVAFIEEWDHLRDDIRQHKVREPTLEEYAKEWRVPVSSAYRRLQEFRAVVGMRYPGPLCDLLWDGMPKWNGEAVFRPKWLLAVEIVEV